MNDRVWAVLKTALDGVALRQAALAENIANVDTPGYRRFDVVLQEAFTRFQGLRTDPRHIPIGDAENQKPHYGLVQDRQTITTTNQNNVDLDYEMASLADNQLRYQTLVELFNAKAGSIRYVLREGR
ncbi:MAG: flagellar basal body rod protein FlgB [Hydrogenibacillus sp.]|nr:flagellar basal body rod protein FlgB [Hydrogenibacillus sp.]